MTPTPKGSRTRRSTQSSTTQQTGTLTITSKATSSQPSKPRNSQVNKASDTPRTPQTSPTTRALVTYIGREVAALPQSCARTEGISVPLKSVNPSTIDSTLAPVLYCRPSEDQQAYDPSLHLLTASPDDAELDHTTDSEKSDVLSSDESLYRPSPQPAINTQHLRRECALFPPPWQHGLDKYGTESEIEYQELYGESLYEDGDIGAELEESGSDPMDICTDDEGVAHGVSSVQYWRDNIV